MRKLLALLAGSGLAYSGYQLFTAQTSGGTLVDIIMRSADPMVPYLSYHLIGFAASALVLIVLAFGKTRVILQEQRFDDLHKFIQQNVPWLEKMERKHARAEVLKNELLVMETRLAALTSTSSGLQTLMSQIGEMNQDVQSRIAHVSRDKGGNDIADLADELVRKISDTLGRLQKLESAFASVPGLAVQADTFAKRVEALESEKDGIIKSLGELREVIDDLLDSSDNGKIADLEAGDPNESGDLDDQIGDLEDRAEDIAKRLVSLAEQFERMSKIRLSLVKAGSPPVADNVVPGPRRA